MVGALAAGHRDGAFWAVNSLAADFPRSASTLPCPEAQTRALAATPTRLAAMPRETRLQLANRGYAVADAGLRSWVTPSLPEPAGFPWPGGLG